MCYCCILIVHYEKQRRFRFQLTEWLNTVRQVFFVNNGDRYRYALNEEEGTRSDSELVTKRFIFIVSTYLFTSFMSNLKITDVS